MSLEQIAGIATIIGTLVSIASLVVSSSILIKVNRIRIEDHSKSASQVAKGDKNKQSIRQK